MELGQTTAAIKSLKLAARHYAGNEQLLVDVSSRLIIMGDPQGALTATEEGVRRYENNAQLLLNRADALRLVRSGARGRGSHARAGEREGSHPACAPDRAA